MLCVKEFLHQSLLKAYRNSWTLDARVGRWTLDAGLWTLDTGLWTLGSGLRALDSGRWTLDADHQTLILRTALILCFQSWRVSQRRNDTLIILQTKNRADSFFITGKYHTKKQNITSHLKVFSKRATRQAKIRQKTSTVTLFYSNNIECSPMAKDVTYTLLGTFL